MKGPSHKNVRRPVFVKTKMPEESEVNMIYTMTLNPALDYNMITTSFQAGRVNRSSSEYFMMGGKGLMESQVLKNLGVPSVAMGMIAGFTGKALREMLNSCGIATDFVELKQGLTRINVKLWGALEGEINAAGPECDEESLEKLMKKLQNLTKEDILVLAGTVPKSVPRDIYATIVRQMAQQGVRTVVDTSGQALKEVIQYRPFLVKPNHHELGEIYGVELKTAEEVWPYAERMQREGAENVLVSMGGDGALLCASDGSRLYAKAPKGEVKNTVGAGDSMVAGFLAQYLASGSFAEALRNGIACGSASAFSDGLATRDEVEQLRPLVLLE